MATRFVSLLAAGLFGALIAGSASATTPKTVALSVNITGAGTVRVGSRVVSCAGMACHQTIRVRRGSRVVIRVTPRPGWKLTASSGACKSSRETCSLRLVKAAQIAVTLSAQGSQAYPMPLGIDGLVNGVGGRWYVAVLSSQLQGNDTIVQVQVTLDGKLGAVGWLFGLYYSMFVTPGPIARGGVPVGFPVGYCTPPAPNLMDLGGYLAPYGPGAVAAGQEVTANLCFRTGNPQPGGDLLITPAVAFPPLEVSEGLSPSEIGPPIPANTVWFALQ